MKQALKVATVISLAIILIPSVGIAKKRTSYATDANARTFTKTKVLPGGINVEFSLVTLGQYEKDVNKVFDYAFSETERIASMFEGSNSEISNVAASAGQQPVKVSKEVYVLAEHAREIAEWTSGAFDPVRGDGTYKNLKIDKKEQTLFLTKPGLTLDLNGILEGFLADLFIRAAYHAGLDDALVQVNGVARSMGRGSFGPWQIRLTGSGSAQARHGMDVTISNYSAATVGGGFYAPAVDPRNGKPIDNNLSSVTVLAEKAATAEGVASSIYVLGRFAGEMLIGDLGIRAIFGYKDGTFKKIGSW